jgi:hypothetical protein
VGWVAALDLEETLVEENEGNLRLADLLGFKRETPTRARLLAGHAHSSLMNDVSEDGKVCLAVWRWCLCRVVLVVMVDWIASDADRWMGV